MKIHLPHRPHSRVEDGDEPEPGLLPVEPDTGPVPPVAPADPAPDHDLDPEA